MVSFTSDMPAWAITLALSIYSVLRLNASTHVILVPQHSNLIPRLYIASTLYALGGIIVIAIHRAHCTFLTRAYVSSALVVALSVLSEVTRSPTDTSVDTHS